MCEFIMI